MISVWYFLVCTWSPIRMVLNKRLLSLGSVRVDVRFSGGAVAPLLVFLGIHNQHGTCNGRNFFSLRGKKTRKTLNIRFIIEEWVIGILPVMTTTKTMMTTITMMRTMEVLSSGMGALSTNKENFCSLSIELPEPTLNNQIDHLLASSTNPAIINSSSCISIELSEPTLWI